MKVCAASVQASLSTAAGLVLLSHVSAWAGMSVPYQSGAGTDVSHRLAQASDHSRNTGVAFTPIACPGEEPRETPQTCAQPPASPFHFERVGNTVVVKVGSITHAEAPWNQPQSFVAIEQLAEGELLSDLKLDTSEAGAFAEQAGWSLAVQGRRVILTWTPASHRASPFSDNRNTPYLPPAGTVTWGDMYPNFFTPTSGPASSASSGNNPSSSLANQPASGTTTVVGGSVMFSGNNGYSGISGSLLSREFVGDRLPTGSQAGITVTSLGSLTLDGILGSQVSWSVTQLDLDVSLFYVPEPSTWALLAGLSVLTLAWKRRSANR